VHSWEQTVSERKQRGRCRIGETGQEKCNEERVPF
jgi:hypothetical protein